MLRGIDHIVILVRDLAQASDDYARAGFTVTPGGEHAGGATHNALVAFGDGAYFELIAFREPDRPQGHRWWPRVVEGEGMIDYALYSDDLEADARTARERGLRAPEPIDGGRTRPDGQRIAWRSVMLGRGIIHPALPFLIQDVTPREARVPGAAATRHALPVTRVAGLTVLTANLSDAASALGMLPGVQARQPAAEGTLRLALGRHWLELVQPADETSEAGRHLRAHGDGPYEVVLSGDGGADPGAGELLPLEATHGARIRVAG